jgi:hypothetical protein
MKTPEQQIKSDNDMNKTSKNNESNIAHEYSRSFSDYFTSMENNPKKDLNETASGITLHTEGFGQWLEADALVDDSID